MTPTATRIPTRTTLSPRTTHRRVVRVRPSVMMADSTSVLGVVAAEVAGLCCPVTEQNVQSRVTPPLLYVASFGARSLNA